MPRTGHREPGRRGAAPPPALRHGREVIPAELDFEDDDGRAGRVGDPVDPQTLRERFPARRVREAGRTAGEVRGRDVTADDLTRDNLLSDDASHTRGSNDSPRAADTGLRTVDARAIGPGGGPDEAELAQRQPISRSELRQKRKRVARSGGPLSNVEPYESGAGSPGRQRNTRRS